MSHYTTKYAYFEEAAVDFKILSFLWDEKDEPKDVDLASQLMIKELAGLGK
ncbi:hypothetical protein [Vibrio gazogenes]|nr:hypothetical protein [Vibrio gazogenes]